MASVINLLAATLENAPVLLTPAEVAQRYRVNVATVHNNPDIYPPIRVGKKKKLYRLSDLPAL